MEDTDFDTMATNTISFAEDSNEDEDEEMPSEVEDLAENPEEPMDPAEAMLKSILEIMNLNGPSKASQSKKEVLSDEDQRIKEDMYRKCDALLVHLREDPLYKSALLRDATAVRPAVHSDRFSWAKVGALCWVKHKEYERWPGIIKTIKKAKGAKNWTQTSVASVMFLEPKYEYFLHYSKKALSYAISSLHPFTSMSPEGSVRSLNQIEQSHKSWVICAKYLDYTYYELSERMAVLCERFRDKLVITGGDTKLNLDLLGGLYWLANAIWLKMNGIPVDLPPRPESCSEWKELLRVLEDVSYWRRDSQASEHVDKQKRRSYKVAEDMEEDYKENGYYGYGFIQVALHRDPTDKNFSYSPESQQIVAQREDYGMKIIDIVKSPECKAYLRNLRDLPSASPHHTERSRRWKKNETWDLLNQSIKSPTGPVVVDSQVLELYRIMKSLRLRKDVDNGRFMRACYEVWLPEALIYAIRKIKGVSYEDAEKEYESDPIFVQEEKDANWDKAPTLSMVDVVHQSSAI